MTKYHFAHFWKNRLNSFTCRLSVRQVGNRYFPGRRRHRPSTLLAFLFHFFKKNPSFLICELFFMLFYNCCRKGLLCGSIGSLSFFLFFLQLFFFSLWLLIWRLKQLVNIIRCMLFFLMTNLIIVKVTRWRKLVKLYPWILRALSRVLKPTKDTQSIHEIDSLEILWNPLKKKIMKTKYWECRFTLNEYNEVWPC